MSEDAGPLLALLAIEEQARRSASLTELAFVAVNQTKCLTDYRQAILFRADGKLAAVSGAASLEHHAPFALWAGRLWRESRPQTLSAADRTALSAETAAEWDEWLPPHALWLPLTAPGGQQVACLLLARDQPWQPAEFTLLDRAAAIFAFAWIALDRPSWTAMLRGRIMAVPRFRWVLAALAVLVALAPVRLSVLAPAEIVADTPSVVRAPLDGVIERVVVLPNQSVHAGDALIELDRTVLSGKAEIARKALSTAQAELDLATQQAFFDPKAKAQMAVIRARIDERNAELAQLSALLDRARVVSPRDGTVVLDDPSEWIGRPVAVGERILAVADPKRVKVEAWLSPADLIALKKDGPVTVFLDATPLAPVAARLDYVTYQAVARPDGTHAHRVRASLTADQNTRLGQKGTARLDGARVPLVFWLLRRPLAAVRTTLGF
jgi:multidrug efflux pump subunit AcrA (membrane-fusion protein)